MDKKNEKGSYEQIINSTHVKQSRLTSALEKYKIYKFPLGAYFLSPNLSQ